VTEPNPYFSIFTPTYNRAYSLPRVFDCLQKQSFRDFEWVIVDDGSTDNTKELVEKWKTIAHFPIIYQWQPNQGKHIAYNTAAACVRGELFTSIDSDDEIIPEALSIMVKRWTAVPEEQKKNISGMLFLSKDQHGNIVGDRFPADGMVADPIEMFLVKKIKGDKGGFLRTSVFKMYPYPDTVKNVLVPEILFIHKLARDWKTIFINEVLRIYWVDEREDHLGNQLADVKSYSGIRLSYLALLNYSARFFKKIPKTFFANTAHYIQTSLYLKIGLARQWRDIRTASGRFAWLLMLPFGYWLYSKKKKLINGE
jgi:glycosyltransferase involved in cell wall biosynthesis